MWFGFGSTFNNTITYVLATYFFSSLSNGKTRHKFPLFYIRQSIQLDKKQIRRSLDYALFQGKFLCDNGLIFFWFDFVDFWQRLLNQSYILIISCIALAIGIAAASCLIKRIHVFEFDFCLACLKLGLYDSVRWWFFTILLTISRFNSKFTRLLCSLLNDHITPSEIILIAIYY